MNINTIINEFLFLRARICVGRVAYRWRRDRRRANLQHRYLGQFSIVRPVLVRLQPGTRRTVLPQRCQLCLWSSGYLPHVDRG